jgi:hypothetical protein
MPASPTNALGGLTVSIPPVPVIDSNGNVVTNVVTNGIVKATSFLYANGLPLVSPIGGSNTYVQFNNNGVLDGSSNFTYISTSNTLNITNITVSGNTDLSDVGNVKILGGINGYVLQTDGTGNLSWTAQTGGGGGGNGTPGGTNTQIQFNDAGNFGGAVGFTYNKANDIVHVNTLQAGNVNSNYFFGNGYYLSGIDTNLANYVVAPNQSNITSVGTLTGLSINGDLNVHNISIIGNLTAINGLFTNQVVIGSNLTINPGSTFRSFGNVNFNTVPNVSLGTSGNVHIYGGLNGYVLSTDGTGNLSWIPGGGGNGSPGGQDTQVQFNDAGVFAGSANFTFNQYSKLLTVDQTLVQIANITNTLNVPNTAIVSVSGNINASSSKNINLGYVGNVHIQGGYNGQVLGTDGLGNLSWVNKSGGGGGGSPGGANSQVQFNLNGNFGASPSFVFDSTSTTLTLAGNVIGNAFTVGSGTYQFATTSVFFATTASAGPNQLLYTSPLTVADTIDFTIIATDFVNSTRQTSKISATCFTNVVAFNEYASLYVNGGIGTFSVVYFPGDTNVPASMQLKVTPNLPELVTYKILVVSYAPTTSQ